MERKGNNKRREKNRSSPAVDGKERLRRGKVGEEFGNGKFGLKVLGGEWGVARLSRVWAALR